MPPLLIGISGVKQSGKGTAFGMIAEWGRPLSLSAKERGFADYVKWSLARIFMPGISMEDAVKWVDKFKEDEDAWFHFPTDPDTHKHHWHNDGITMRQAAQHLGTEMGRDLYGGDFWVDLLLPAEPTARNPEGWRSSFMVEPKTDRDWPYSIADLCGVTDLRFESEFERFQQLRHEEDISVRSELFVPAHVITIKLRRKVAEDAVVEQARQQGKKVHRSELGLEDELFDHVVYNDGTLVELENKLTAVMYQHSHDTW